LRNSKPAPPHARPAVRGAGTAVHERPGVNEHYHARPCGRRGHPRLGDGDAYCIIHGVRHDVACAIDRPTATSRSFGVACGGRVAGRAQYRRVRSSDGFLKWFPLYRSPPSCLPRPAGRQVAAARLAAAGSASVAASTTAAWRWRPIVTARSERAPPRALSGLPQVPIWPRPARPPAPAPRRAAPRSPRPSSRSAEKVPPSQVKLAEVLCKSRSRTCASLAESSTRVSIVSEEPWWKEVAAASTCRIWKAVPPESTGPYGVRVRCSGPNF